MSEPYGSRDRAAGDEAEWDIELFTPRHWYLVTGQPEKDQLAIPAEVDAVLERRPEWRIYRQAMIDPMLTLANSMTEVAGLVCTAFRWEMTAYGLVTATVIIRCYDREPGPVESELMALAALAAEQEATDRFPPVVATVNLPVGTAVRREVVVEPPPEGDEDQPLRLAVDHWVPLDIAPGRALGIRAGTANLAMAATLVPEFDAIAEGCVVRRSGEYG